MSRALGSQLPDELFRRLNGAALEAVASKVIPIVTVDEHGWPHPALLSYFEVVAADRSHLRCATYATSRTTANMRRTGKITLAMFDERMAYYVKAHAVELAPSLAAAEWNAGFDCRVEQVLSDEVDERYEPGAYVAGGITYHNPNRGAELERARATLAELKGLR